MRNLWIVGLVVAIALSSVVVVVPTARAVTTRPQWSMGDYWAYDVNGTSPTLPASGTLRETVVSLSDSAVVDGVTYPSYKLAVVTHLVIPSPTNSIYVNMTGNAWYRISDLSLVREDMSGTFEVSGFPLSADERSTWSPPQDIQWPLSTGNTWSTMGWSNTTITAGVITLVNSSYYARTNWVVEADQSTTVSAGTFTTTPLHGYDAGGSENISYWSPDAGNFVLQRFVAGTDIQRVELTSYRYAFVQDTAPPAITGVTATPSPQDAGKTVTIGATVTDDIQVASVFVNVTVPGGTHVNASMTAGAGNRWTNAQTWSVVGVHNFVIWASDVVGKWASLAGSFTIRQPDTEKPVITHTPPGGTIYTDTAITITATVTDNVAVSEVRLDFTNATGVHQNLTMSNGTGGTTYTFTIPAQGVAGTVAYKIYAVDPSGNVAVTQQYSLTIQTPSGISGYLVPILIVIILVVVLAVAVVLWRRKKKGASSQQAEPPAAPPPATPPPP